MSGSASAAAPDPDRDARTQASDGGAPADAPAARQAASQAAQQPPPAAPATGAASDRQTTAAPADPQAAPTPGDRQAAPPPREPAPSTDARQRPSTDPADFLITSADRDAAEARLRRAVADELLTLDEFGDRMRKVLAAKTRGELRAAVSDLPLAAEPVQRTRERGTARPAREQGFIVAIMSGTEVRGRWRPAPNTTALAVMGSTVVDLQGAEYEGDELTLNAVAFMGGVDIIVPEGVEVIVSGFDIMGGRDVKVHGSALPDAPVVHIQAYTLMGGIDIRHPKKKDLKYVDQSRGAFADRVPLRSADYAPPRAAARRRTPSRVGQTVRSWFAGLLAAAAIAAPVGWAAMGSDQVGAAVFSSNDVVVSEQSVADGEDVTVGAITAFGSVKILVPEGVNVERDGLVIFGSTECQACNVAGAVAADAPTVRVKTVGGFGSVEIQRIGAAELD